MQFPFITFVYYENNGVYTEVSTVSMNTVLFPISQSFVLEKTNNVYMKEVSVAFHWEITER